MTNIIIPHASIPAHKKPALADIALYALSHGEWTMVAAIILLILRKEMAHA